MVEVHWADGRTDTYHDYAEACDAVRGRYPQAEIGHSGDLADDGDRTLCWADAAAAEDDAGLRAVATIRETRE